MTDSNFLTRSQVDEIIDHMTPRDLFAAMPKDAGEVSAGPEIAARMFDAAAERQGFGAGALDRVTIADGLHMATRMGEVLTAGSPKDAKPRGRQPSPASGG